MRSSDIASKKIRFHEIEVNNQYFKEDLLNGEQEFRAKYEEFRANVFDKKELAQQEKLVS